MADATDPMVWMRRLYAELACRRPTVERCARYYDGDHNLGFASEKFLEAFGGLFRAFADNWCGTVVDAVEERLNVEGFRVSSDDPKADSKAWTIWQRNELDAQSQIAHQESLYAGASFLTAWPDENEQALITVESAASAIVDCHPKFTRQRRAALRTFVDDDGYEHAELFLPERVYQFRSKAKATNYSSSKVNWIVDPDSTNDLDASGSMPNPLRVVPMVELRNRPRLYTSRRVGFAAHSEISPIIPLQDAVNKLVADMLVASEFAAAPQRWMTGYEPKTDPTTGQEVPPNWRPGAGRTWTAESTDAAFGSFEVAQLSNFTTAIGMMIQHIASISRTPQHYLDSSADRLSGESIKAAETPLIAKTKRKMRPLGEAWEEIMRIAGQIDGVSELAEAAGMETIWADPETRTEAEHVDATLKKQALGVPNEQLWEDVGYTPQQIERFRSMAATSALMTFAGTQADALGQAAAAPPRPPMPAA